MRFQFKRNKTLMFFENETKPYKRACSYIEIPRTKEPGFRGWMSVCTSDSLESVLIIGSVYHIDIL